MDELAISNLRLKVINDPDLNVPVDDHFLLKFLWAKKFDVDLAHDKIRRYQFLRQQYRSSFEKFDVNHPRMLELWTQNWGTVLENRDQHGRRISIVTAKNFNAEVSDLDDIFIAIQLYVEVTIMEPETQQNGYVIVIYLKGLNFHHYKQITFSNARKGACLYDGIPAKFKGIHIVNEPSPVRFLYNYLLASLLKKKQRKRIMFHGKDLESLHKVIKPQFLPENLGGLLPPYDCTYIVQRVRDDNARLQELNDKLLNKH